MVEQNHILIGAIRKLALAGDAGFSVEEMVELLKTGVSVETLLDLVVARIATLISVPNWGR